MRKRKKKQARNPNAVRMVIDKAHTKTGQEVLLMRDVISQACCHYIESNQKLYTIFYYRDGRCTHLAGYLKETEQENAWEQLTRAIKAKSRYFLMPLAQEPCQCCGEIGIGILPPEEPQYEEDLPGLQQRSEALYQSILNGEEMA